MERVLDIYKRPYDRRHPMVCMDETPRQLIRETRPALSVSPGKPARYDYEYERCGVCNLFLAVEPLAGQRLIQVSQRKTKSDWAHFVQALAERYSHAEKITLVMDNLNTHGPGSLYETFAPAEAKALWDRFEFVYTPKHGSWLNMAEIELSVLTRQCLNRRIGSLQEMANEVDAWQTHRNNANAQIDWQFTTDSARVKLKRLYPTL
jgi:transposase